MKVVIKLKGQKKKLKKWVKITIFLIDKLELELNSKTQIFKNTQGVNFCGYKINEYRLKKIVKLKNQVLNLKHENQLLSKYKDKTKSKVKDQLIEELKQEIAELQYENKMLKEKRQ